MVGCGGAGGRECCKQASEIKGREEQRSVGPLVPVVTVVGVGHSGNMSVTNHFTKQLLGPGGGTGGEGYWLYLQAGTSLNPKAVYEIPKGQD